MLQACALCPFEDGELAYYLDGSYYESDYDTEHADHDAVYHSDRYTHAAHRKESRHGYADRHHLDRKNTRLRDGHKDSHKDGRKARHQGRHAGTTATGNEKRHRRGGHNKAEFSEGRRQHSGLEGEQGTQNNPSRLDDPGWITVNMPSGQVRVPTGLVRRQAPPKASRSVGNTILSPERIGSLLKARTLSRGRGVTSYSVSGRTPSSEAVSVKSRLKVRRSPKAQRKAAPSRSKPVETPKRTTVYTPSGQVRIPAAFVQRQAPLKASRSEARRSSKAQRKAASSRSKPVGTSKRTTVQTPMGSVRIPAVVQGRDWTKGSKPTRKTSASQGNRRAQARTKPSPPAY